MVEKRNYCRIPEKKSWIVLLLLASCCIHQADSSTTTSLDTSMPTAQAGSPNEGLNVTTDTPGLTTPNVVTTTQTTDFSYLEKCPDNAPCESLGTDCITCKMNHYCRYGDEPQTECTVKGNLTCIGDRVFNKTYYCRYCYQLDPWLYKCSNSSDSCVVKTAPLQKYNSQCITRDNVLCLGTRSFSKSLPCNWTSGYKWSTALILSITLGGFGVDRFYLGLWREGIGKLFSFGGLGVWTLVDVILIAVGYIGPHDGSLYIYPWN